MKKLYQGKGRRVHPAPAEAAAAAAVVLPAAVLALASALTAEDQEVLAYLLSCSGAGATAGGRPRRRRGAHAPEMGCGCFGCYKSFWARWDASPNRHLIHRIIDAVEEGGAAARRPSRRRRRGGRRCGSDADEDAGAGGAMEEAGVSGVERIPVDCCDDDDGARDGEYEGDGDDEEEEEGVSSMDGDGDDESVTGDSDCNTEKSTVGRLVRFIGEKVWGAWN